MEVAVRQQQYSRNKIHPKKFALAVACASILMMFSAFTSAYIVRQAAGNWLEFQLPSLFFVSTGIILLSSFTLHFSYRSFLKGKEQLYKGLLLTSFGLGLLFIAMQYQGWLSMMEMGVPLKTNPSGDFIYVISGVHAAHVIGGITALVIALLHAFSLKFKVTPARKLRFELTFIYWHFVGFLWLYLIVFFSIQ